MRCLPLLTSAAATGALALAPAADAATTVTIRGAGWGHGIGMSQYGAYGYAKAGKPYDFILRHYYTGTSLAQLDSEPDVRVLLADGRGSFSVSGANRAGGKLVDPAKTYTLVPGDQGVVLRDGRKELFTGSAMALKPQTGGTLVLGGARYRGSIDVRPSGGGLMAVNQLGLEDYVRGVVPRESPSYWPAEALKAQAVAARSYAITTNKGRPEYDQTADTSSQVYGGASAETTATNAAVDATDGQVVTAGGAPVTTYFFSTSGGRTENVEYSWPGAAPKSWLKSVPDPYDAASYYHRWIPTRLTAAVAQARLRGLVKGRFKSIKVTRRGISPRVVSALVVGTRGSTTVSGPTLRSRFGLRDTWAYFTTVSTDVKRKPVAPPAGTANMPGSPTTGGTAPHGALAAAVAARSVPVVHGTIAPGRRGSKVRVQRQSGARWVTVATRRLDARGAYEAQVRRRGVYRVTGPSGVVGPSVRVR
jgi:stage II sporulation protein D